MRKWHELYANSGLDIEKRVSQKKITLQ